MNEEELDAGPARHSDDRAENALRVRRREEAAVQDSMEKEYAGRGHESHSGQRPESRPGV